MPTALALYSLPVAIVLSGIVASCQPHPTRHIADDGWGPPISSDRPAADQPPPPPAPRPQTIPALQRKRWDLADRIPSLTRVPGRSTSEHGRGLERTVAVNQTATAYSSNRGSIPFGAGALIVQSHYAPGSDAPLEHYVMHKRDDRWTYAVLDAELRVAAQGVMGLCERCHADAPHDGVFGPPQAQSP